MLKLLCSDCQVYKPTMQQKSYNLKFFSYQTQVQKTRFVVMKFTQVKFIVHKKLTSYVLLTLIILHTITLFYVN